MIEESYTQIDATEYSLHAMIIHDGSPGLGHYYSFIYDRYNKKWFKYND